MVNTNFLVVILLVVAGYLIGSLSSSILLSKLLKLPDPRTYGSKNPGTTNVFRLAGKRLAAVVLLGDLLKGYLVVLGSQSLGMSNLVTAIVAISVFLGHLFPIYFNFSGGKGIATTLGIMFGICFNLALISLIIWIVVFISFRISSLAGLISAISTMLLAVLALYFKLDYFIIPEFSLCIIFLSLLIILKHKSNIYNLLYRKESKV